MLENSDDSNLPKFYALSVMVFLNTSWYKFFLYMTKARSFTNKKIVSS